MGNSITEQKIKEAARKVFVKKGYDAARTRDIAEEAGVNLALINYYYRSKEFLFDKIILESIDAFRNSLYAMMNDPATSIYEKIRLVVENYYFMFEQNPELPMFIFHELENKNEKIINEINPRGIIHESVFEKQLIEHGKTQEEAEQVFLNIVSIIILPFLGKSFIKILCGVNDTGYKGILNKRKEEIPQWIITMFNL